MPAVLEGTTLKRSITYRPLPSQYRFHECTVRQKGFSGSVGSGKTKALVQEIIKKCVRNPGLDGLLGAPTYRQLRDVSQKALLETLEANEIPFEFSKSENKIVLTDFNSKILCRSLDEPESVRGTNLAWIAVDELTYCKEEAWTRLIGRLREPAARDSQAFAAWTPRGYDWVFDYFIGEKKRSGYEAILATPQENWHLPDWYYPSLATSYDTRLYQQEVLGQYLAISGNQVYYAFDRNVNVKPVEYIPNQPVYWSLDFNVDLMCSVIGQIEDKTTYQELLTGKSNRVARILDEIALPNSNVPEVCEEFKRRMEPLTRRGLLQVLVYGDASGGARTHAGTSSYRIIREHFQNDTRFNLVIKLNLANNNVSGDNNPAVQARVNSMNAMFLNHAGDRRLTIDPRCRTLIKDLEQVVWKDTATGNQSAVFDKQNKLMTHMSDAAGYLIFGEFGLKQKGQAMPGSVF